MYTLIRSAALPNTVTPQWTTQALGGELVKTLFATYRKIFLVMTLDADPTELYINLEQLRAEYATYGNTLTVLLQVLGARVLATTDMPEGLPSAKIGYAKYSDIYRLGYKAALSKRGFEVPDGYPKDELPDLELTRPDYATDLSLIHSQCLVSVNGFFHRTDTDGERAYVIDGGETCRQSNSAHIGLTSFMSIAPLVKRSLDVDLIGPKVDGTAMKAGLQFSVADDLTGKSVFLVLGGYLVMPEDLIFYQVSDHSFELNIARLPYLERILESREWINLDSLKLTVSEINPDSVNIEEVWSDAVLLRYLTMSQSFLVIVDNDSLFTNKILIKQMNSPGWFIAYQNPTSPLIVGFGRAAEYWKVYEDGLWSVTVEDSFRRNFIFNRQPENTLTNVTSQLACDRPFTHSLGFLLEIGANKE